MTDPARELLLGYLLGALDESEQEEVESRLNCDLGYRREWRLLRRQLQDLEAARDDYDDDPPPGLARRTCELVFSQSKPAPAPRRPMSPQPAVAISSHRMGWLDVTVAAAVLLAAGMLVLPAIQGTRFQTRLMACQDNLRQLGASLAAYSRGHDQYFPRVPAEGQMAAAGIYAPVLLGDGFLTEPRRVVCPDSAMAENRDFRVPSLVELQSAAPEETVQIRGSMGGSYGYCLGYNDHGVVRPTRDQQRASFALMSDAPSDRPDHQTTNHGGWGQNVLFEDGHVVYLKSSKPCEDADDIFFNDDHQVAVGLHRDDSVIGASDTPPTSCANRR